MRSWTAASIPVLPPTADTPLRVRVRDTATGELVDPLTHDRASLYVCGITPYDATHLGHAATYLTFDLLVRAWLDAGCTVDYTQNVTDVDDPLLERATATGEDWRELAERETELYRADMTALRVLPPTRYRGAVETIPDVVAAVERMIADRTAYRIDLPGVDGAGAGDIYADLAADPRFGRDTHDLDETTNLQRFAEMGGDPQRAGKRDPLDPLLWRAARAGEPAWDGETLGPGRPGWHIECATMAAATIGAPFAVQGGGADLRFPHHAMSASHLRMLSGTPRPVRAHVHVGLVGYQGHKMSKSRGNLVLVSRLREAGVDPMVIRLAVLAHRYDGEWEFRDEEFTTAAVRLARWRVAVARPAGPDALGLLAEVRASLADDLDAPRALAAVDAWASSAVEPEGADATAPGLVRDLVDALLGVEL